MYFLQVIAVIQVLSQTADALSPVLPWTLEWTTPVTQATHCRDQAVEPARPMDNGVGAHHGAFVSFPYAY